MNREGQRLLKNCLDHPEDSVAKLIYADWLEEQPWGLCHSRFVRMLARYYWFNSYFKGKVGIRMSTYTTAPGSCVAFAIYREIIHLWKQRQEFSWSLAFVQTSPPEIVRHYRGRSPNLHNAKRRALQALLTCRRRNCVCGRGNDCNR